MNDTEIKIGRKLFALNAKTASVGGATRGGLLLQAYCDMPRRGDPNDLRSNAVDVMVALGHFAHSQGILPRSYLAASGVDGTLATPSVDVSGYISCFEAMEAVLEANGDAYDAAVRTVWDHLGSMIRDVDAGPEPMVAAQTPSMP